ncbi:MAG: right-handed parallel beta-helix repeat-containing protein [Acidobacteriia bacterium]|nr:right-handed parallel beta-helix repeat-containing protein [Terriglobia bacterium]
MTPRNLPRNAARVLAEFAVLLLTGWLATMNAATDRTGVLLPDGREFVSWEKPLQFTKTCYVDNRNPKASDLNPGTKELPFLTINKAAQVLEPGERVVIMSGIYRERVSPARGGTGPDKMISYEAAPGATVVVKGSRLVKTGWEPSNGYNLGRFGPAGSTAKIYQRRLDDLDFQGYNPVGMVNVMGDREYLRPKPEELKPHLLRRGMVFVDGQRLEQVELYWQLAQKDGTFWCEHHGLTVHVRPPGDADPAQHEVELVIQEQVFAPRQRELGYIRIKGITFEHAANGFPVPQRGLVSANCGHHWIIEDCVIRHANSVALDIGYQDWNMVPPAIIGHSIVRRTHISDAGVCGLAGMGVQETLVESNLIEQVGWQNVELMWESGGIKLHVTKNCLLRNNIIRHLSYAPGIWLDYQNANTRVTGNLIGDLKETVRGGIYLEASQDRNMLDHNIIWKVSMGKGGAAYNIPPHGGWGIITDGSDEAVIAHNLFGYTQDAGVKTRTVEERIVGARGGTSRWSQVLNNIFFRCGRSIDFSHRENKADGNLYAKGGREVEDEYQAEGRGLNWISGPGPALRLDLSAWQKYFGFDLNGAYAEMNIELDLDALQMTWSVSGKVPEVPTGDHFQRDFLGQGAAKTRPPGPFLQVPGAATTIGIDPRSLAR